MSTVRTKKNKNYTTISNIVLNDVALSWKAKGLAAYLLSKPDDWNVQREHLAKQSEDGISAVRSALQELEKFGYLVRQKTRNEKGIIEWEYILHEEPQNREPLREKEGVRKRKGAKPSAENQPVDPSADNPPVENPPVENPPVENPPVENRTLLSTNIVSTEEPSTENEVSEGDRARAAPPSTTVTPTPPAQPPATPPSETRTATAKPRMGSEDYDHPGVKAKAPSPNSGAPLPKMERTVFVTPKRGRPNADTLSPHVKGAKFTDADLVEPNTGKNPVAVFYEFYSIYDNRLSAPVEDRLVKRNLNLAQWRSAVEAWQDADHRPTYIKGILDWYNDPSKYARKEATNGANHSRGGAQRPNQPVAPENYTAPAIKFYTNPDDPF